MLVYINIYIYKYSLPPLPPLPPHSLLLPTATQQRHPMLVYIYIYKYMYSLLSSTTTITPQSPSANCYSAKTPNVSLQKYFYIQLPFSPLPPLSPHCLLLPTATQQRHPMLVYIYNSINTTTLSLLYHHYHPTVSFCQLLLSKDAQC